MKLYGDRLTWQRFVVYPQSLHADFAIVPPLGFDHFHIILHVTFTSFPDIELSVIVGDGGKVDKQITKSGFCTDATRIAST